MHDLFPAISLRSAPGGAFRSSGSEGIGRAVAPKYMPFDLRRKRMIRG